MRVGLSYTVNVKVSRLKEGWLEAFALGRGRERGEIGAFFPHGVGFGRRFRGGLDGRGSGLRNEAILGWRAREWRGGFGFFGFGAFFLEFAEGVEGLPEHAFVGDLVAGEALVLLPAVSGLLRISATKRMARSMSQWLRAML